MSSPAAPIWVAGWFGKIPALGDFATRRLPASFVTPWDEWLSVELAEVRAAWGDQWAANYRQLPPVCFAIDARVVDHQAWHGILIPSYDRVGREFPLTVAQSRRPHVAAPQDLQWWAGLVAVGWRALQPRVGAAEFDAAVEAFFNGHGGEPAAVQGSIEATPAWRSGWWRWRDGDSSRPDGAPASQDCGDCQERISLLGTTSELPRGEDFRKLIEQSPASNGNTSGERTAHC